MDRRLERLPVLEKLLRGGTAHAFPVKKAYGGQHAPGGSTS